MCVELVERTSKCRPAGFIGATASIAELVLLLLAFEPAVGEEVSLLPSSGGQPSEQTQRVDPIAQGHRLLSYQTFCRELKLPSIVVVEPGVIGVGGEARVHTGKGEPLTEEQGQAVAAQLGVPLTALDRLLATAVTDSRGDTSQVAKDFRTGIADHRFLQVCWAKHTPSASGVERKAKALQALEEGNLPIAWSLYLEVLPQQPGAPRRLRIVGS